MSARIQVYLEDEFAEILLRQKPKSLSLSRFVGFCVEQYVASLDTATKLPAYCVGAEDTVCVNDSVYNKQKLTQEEIPSGNFLNSSPPREQDRDRGESVGRESEGNPRKGGKGKGIFVFAKSIPNDLEWCRSELLEYWSQKGGKKSQQAATYLCNQLIKLAEKYGERVVLDQLELATAKGFDSISVRNYEMFGLESNKPKNKTDIDWEGLNNVDLF